MYPVKPTVKQDFYEFIKWKLLKQSENVVFGLIIDFEYLAN